jgi:uncharacterized membrane protein
MILSLSLSYFSFSFLVGIWNATRSNSFWTAFIGSLLLSPLIGAFVVGVTKKHLPASAH